MTSSILNKSTARKRALEFGSLRAWKPERVSADFINRFEARCINVLRDMVAEHPSKGKTLM